MTKKLLIDVREPSEFETIHIKNSVNIPLSEFKKNSKEIEKIKDDIVLVCRSGNRAGTACSYLKNKKNVEILQGGIIGNNKSNYKFITNPNKWDIERQVRLVAGSMILTGVLLGFFISKWFFILSGFVGAGLIFASITNSCAMGMMLMKLPYNKGKKINYLELIKRLSQ